ncbi:hypothetical protein F5Y04DRAFT_243769 [Hypomontagnella monticulosa]|nr:hypothetical protein F5Y04DRAFT_243769 [Hypomontagnella monticulosa]
MVSSETYRAIQSWIAQQQEYEAKHSTPAPLTDAQRKLLEKLESALPPATPLLPEPEFDDTNWIGMLLEYRAARHRVPDGVSGNFVEIEGPVAYGVQRWHCQVRVDEHPQPFPGPSGGLVGGNLPSFARKKDAKKYAAKCAIEWLRSNGYIHNGGNTTTSQPSQPPLPQEQLVAPQPSTPAKKKQKLSPSTPERPQAPISKPESNEPEIHPGSPLPKALASPFNDDEVTAVKEVAKLCRRLGLKGELQYKITRMSETSDFYKGYAELGMLASQLPEGVGHVKDVFGKKPAREKIAEELLEPLRKLAAKFDEQDRQFLASPRAAKGDESTIPA